MLPMTQDNILVSPESSGCLKAGVGKALVFRPSGTGDTHLISRRPLGGWPGASIYLGEFEGLLLVSLVLHGGASSFGRALGWAGGVQDLSGSWNLGFRIWHFGLGTGTPHIGSHLFSAASLFNFRGSWSFRIAGIKT